MNRPLCVQKYGGTSVANVDRIRSVARRAVATRRDGYDVVVVVSAMSGTTDRLLRLAQEILPLPTVREQDVILATGEQISVALTAMAIQAEGGEARSLLGHQLPVATDGAFTRARIHHIGEDLIREALARGEIPVVAGFQGVDAQNNITTLGRGGSDTTAVALAAALGASTCEIYTDVDGVYTADPRVCPAGRKLRSIAYEDMLELASLGAKVLQVRSVEIAMKYQVPVHVRSSSTEEEGTWIVKRHEGIEHRPLSGIACARGQARVEIVGAEHDRELLSELGGLLAELNTVVDMLCHAVGAPNARRTTVAFVLPEDDLRRARGRLESILADQGGEMQVTTGLARVSLVGIGVRSDPDIPARLCRSLARAGIDALGLVVNELRISCLVDEAAADQAVRVLHDAFGLSSPDGAGAPGRDGDRKGAA